VGKKRSCASTFAEILVYQLLLQKLQNANLAKSFADCRDQGNKITTKGAHDKNGLLNAVQHSTGWWL